MNIDISKFEFEETVYNPNYFETIYYFIGPKEAVADKYPEAESSEIALIFYTPGHIQIQPKRINAAISPTKDGEDYEWTDIYPDDQEVDTLMKKVPIKYLFKGE